MLITEALFTQRIKKFLKIQSYPGIMRQVLYLLFIFFISACGQEKKIALPPQIDKIDTYIKGLEKEGVYGSFLVIQSDSIIFQKNIGYSNKEKIIKGNSNTIYPYGSITKEYTLSLILHLALEKKIGLNDKLANYFRNVPGDKKNITIEQLLKHRSGLQEYHDKSFREKYKNIPADMYPISKEEALKEIFNQKLKFTPGVGESYSNSGYTLLALIIEKVTSLPYDKAVLKYIIDPANATTADFYGSKKWKPENTAVGYGKWKYGKENSSYYWPRNGMTLIGNGGLAGSLTDLYKGLKFMINKEEVEIEYGQLAEQYRYLENLPNDYITYGGGDDLGFVTGYFVKKSQNKYFLFSINNNEGDNHAGIVRDIILILFNFDFATLAPEQFSETNSSKNEEKFLTKNDLVGKWKLPPGERFQKIGIFLDLITMSDDLTIDEFLRNHCTIKYAKSAKSSVEKWPFSKSLEYKKMSESGNKLKVKLLDTVSNNQYQFLFSFDSNRIKSIRFNKL